MASGADISCTRDTFAPIVRLTEMLVPVSLIPFLTSLPIVSPLVFSTWKSGYVPEIDSTPTKIEPWDSYIPEGHVPLS